MANEIRLRSNNIAGTITDNPLTSGSTTINSPGFADLPVVDGTNHLILILDPLETTGPAEIVRVTAHTSLATSVTVSRGAEGSSARSHIFGSTWFHGPVASDYLLSQLTSGTRPTPAYEGQFIYETDTNKFVGFGGVDWAPRDAGGQLNYAQVVASQTLTAAADLTGLSVPVTVGTGRRIRITAQCVYDNDNAAVNLAFLEIRESGAFVARSLTPLTATATAGQTSTAFVQHTLTPSAGAHTYNLHGTANLFNVVMFAAATNPAFILVEDIGAA